MQDLVKILEFLESAALEYDRYSTPELEVRGRETFALIVGQAAHTIAACEAGEEWPHEWSNHYPCPWCGKQSPEPS